MRKDACLATYLLHAACRACRSCLACFAAARLLCWAVSQAGKKAGRQATLSGRNGKRGTNQVEERRPPASSRPHTGLKHGSGGPGQAQHEMRQIFRRLSIGCLLCSSPRCTPPLFYCARLGGGPSCLFPQLDPVAGSFAPKPQRLPVLPTEESFRSAPRPFLRLSRSASLLYGHGDPRRPRPAH